MILLFYISYIILIIIFKLLEKLGIDENRIAVGGRSAGGGLAAALTLMVRDKKELKELIFQYILYAMLDDRTCLRKHRPYVRREE